MTQESRLGLYGGPQFDDAAAKTAVDLPGCHTTFADLMQALKELISTQTGTGGALSKITQVKRGILPPRLNFPVISLVPVSEVIVRRFSGRLADIERVVDIFIYDRDRRNAGRKAILDLENLVNETKELLLTNHIFQDADGNWQNFGLDFEEIEFSEQDSSRGTLQVARVPAIFISREQLPTVSRDSSYIDAATPTQIADAIHTALEAESSGTLSAAKTIVRGDRGPHGNYPVITVSADLQLVNKAFTGMDEMDTAVEVQLLSSVRRGSDEELVQHLTLIEPIKDVLQGSTTWSGYATNSSLEGIFFDTFAQNNDVAYRSFFTMKVLSRYNTTPYQVFAA